MENEISISTKEILAAVQNKLNEKARFTTATCLDLGTQFEMIYTFQPQDSVTPLYNIRVKFPKDETIPSISGICGAAIIAENEIVGDFKVKMSGLPLDFKGQIMHTRDSLQFPLTKAPPVPKVKQGEAKPQQVK